MYRETVDHADFGAPELSEYRSDSMFGHMLAAVRTVTAETLFRAEKRLRKQNIHMLLTLFNPVREIVAEPAAIAVGAAV